ncbi:TraI/MobA(P) family conjugative relaxase (plasmid) [Brevundimonas olei]|uniref:TraI/MobA(P) family conjugative relaxase n=1 Tax=Brevundimonas olei TaxID=657642 RepID=A0ABZ2ILC5_9CAUL
MIAHKVQRTAATDIYRRLAHYVLDIPRDADSRVLDTPAYNRLVEYISDRPSDGDRVLGARISNCGSNQLSDAIREIGVTQAMNTRSKVDKGYHLVISFPEGERPTQAQLHDIEDHLVAAIGFQDHQRISAIHDDTDHLHVHVAINKVHPTTFRNVTPYMDEPKLMEACIELELKHGLQMVFHGHEAERRTGRNLQPDGRLAPDRGDGHGRGEGAGARRAEKMGGRESFERWLSPELREDLVRVAADAGSWAELHKGFAERGVAVRPRGAGLVIGTLDGRANVKASSVGAGLSFRALTERLGAYERLEPEAHHHTHPSAGSGYDAGPRHDRAASETLFQRYRKEHADSQDSRKQALEAFSGVHGARLAAARANFAGRRDALRKDKRIKGMDKKERWQALGLERDEAFRALKARGAAERAKIRQNTPLPTWQGFLEREASAGDAQALRALRSLYVARTPLGADVLTAADRSAARQIVFQNLSPAIGRDGTVSYRLDDGGHVLDRRDVVQAQKVTIGSAFLALSLASEKFEGQALIIDGSTEFKAALVEVAALRGFDVTFADPAMEKARSEAVELAKTSPAKARPREKVRGAEEYVQERNMMRHRAHGILPHAAWSPNDRGPALYAGLRRFADGSEAVLLQQGEKMLVMGVTANQAAKASQWKRGAIVVTDDRGRFINPERKGPERGS